MKKLSQPFSAKKTILLTGGNGYIGKNIQESFLAQKYEIIAPRSFELNLIDTNCVDEYFKDKEFDIVLHAGTKPGHRNSKDSSNLFYSNTRMFENLERHKDKYGKFINFGSGAIYDTSKNITNAKEEERFNNIGEKDHDFCKYVIGKQIENLDNFVDLNIFGIFGKYEDWQIRFISNAICKTIFDLPITIRQNRKFNYLYINDLTPVLEFFIENDVKYKSYNIVPDKSIELLQLAEIVKHVSGKTVGIKIIQDGFGLDYTGNNSRLKTEFPKIKFTEMETAVLELYKYYTDNINILDKNLLFQDK
jgi:UDP-glucose 4-epimerase